MLKKYYLTLYATLKLFTWGITFLEMFKTLRLKVLSYFHQTNNIDLFYQLTVRGFLTPESLIRISELPFSDNLIVTSFVVSLLKLCKNKQSVENLLINLSACRILKLVPLDSTFLFSYLLYVLCCIKKISNKIQNNFLSYYWFIYLEVVAQNILVLPKCISL